MRNARSIRAQYWWSVLFIFLVLMRVSIIDTFATFGAPTIIIYLAIPLPTLAVTIRRFHDVNRSSCWWWIGVIPIFGGIIQLVFFCTESSRYATCHNRGLITNLRTKCIDLHNLQNLEPALRIPKCAFHYPHNVFGNGWDGTTSALVGICRSLAKYQFP